MKHNNYNIVINFKSRASFFTCFKKLYNKFHTYIHLNRFADEIYIDNLYNMYQVNEIKKIIEELKRKPKNFTVKKKITETLKECVI